MPTREQLLLAVPDDGEDLAYEFVQLYCDLAKTQDHAALRRAHALLMQNPWLVLIVPQTVHRVTRLYRFLC